MSTKETVTGEVTDKNKSTSTSDKAPKGDVYVDKMKLTIWDEEIWDAIEVGKSYAFVCNVQDNEWKGKTYTNRNVVSGMPAEPLEKSDLKIGVYDVIIDDKAIEIHMPKIAIDFLKEKLG